MIPYVLCNNGFLLGIQITFFLKKERLILWIPQHLLSP
jgi:hypothetical protein